MTVFRRLASTLSLVLIVLGSGPAQAQVAGQGDLLLSLGADFEAAGSSATQHAVATFEWRPDTALFWGTKPIWSLGISETGAAYVAGGIRGDFTLGRVLVTPHFSLALYRDGEGGFESKELLQFRTGIDAFVPVGERTMLGIGYYHLSNAGLTSRSADWDVVRLSLLLRY